MNLYQAVARNQVNQPIKLYREPQLQKIESFNSGRYRELLALGSTVIARRQASFVGNIIFSTSFGDETIFSSTPNRLLIIEHGSKYHEMVLKMLNLTVLPDVYFS